VEGEPTPTHPDNGVQCFLLALASSSSLEECGANKKKKAQDVEGKANSYPRICPNMDLN
jgi:hypothetical protein